jgi:hypothetical protein
LLHDFDAMLLRRDMIEERHQAIRERGHQYLGMQYYEGNGLVPTDGLVRTFELMFDLQHVRRSHRPIELFNVVDRLEGRRVDYDTFLHAQVRGGRGSILPAGESDMVHPTQLICHFEDLRFGRRPVPPSNNLMIIPYFLYAGGEPASLRNTTVLLERGNGPSIDFFDKMLDLSRLPAQQAGWIAAQAVRVEMALGTDVRPEVRRYFSALDAFVARSAP